MASICKRLSVVIYVYQIMEMSAFLVGKDIWTKRAVCTLPSREASSLVAARTPKQAGDGGISPKPSRFSQSVHRPKKKKSSAPKQFRKQQQGGPSDSTISRATAPPPDRDRMWKSEKSIEELERKLESRWGTDLTQWTATDANLYDEDEDVGEYEMSTSFWGKPILDPWAKDELDDQKVEKAQDASPRNSKSTQTAKSRSAPALSAFGNQSAARPDQTKSASSQRINLKPLLATDPAGGRGTLLDTNNAETSNRLEKSSAGRRTYQNDSSSAKQRTQKKRAPLPFSTKATPMLDDSGDPVFLTTSQAERIFDEKTAVDTSSDLEEETEPEIVSWSDIGIAHSSLLRNLVKMGCESPLAVQSNSCSSILQGGKDIVVGTYTGSGKTLAFLLPSIQRILAEQKDKDEESRGSNGGGVQLLVVAPGRELASQIATVAREVTEDTDLSVMLAIGGTTFTRNLEQIRKRKPQILVGTPGRVAELIVGRTGEKRGRLHTKRLQSLVLDEFDALLQYKPHSDPTQALLSTIQRVRKDSVQSIFCSATATDMLNLEQKKKENVLSQYLRPGFVLSLAEKNDALVTEATTTKKGSAITRVSRTVMHGVVHIAHRRFALETLRRILYTDPVPQQILVFVSDARRVDVVVDKLADKGIIAAPLHGGMGSEKMDRAQVSKALREGSVGIVVATELAARGLDAPLLTHVVNLDLPTDASHYAHRAGRCGRGGRPGVVINVTTMPQERNVPSRLAGVLGIDAMHSVEVGNSRLNVVDPSTQDLDAL